MLPLPLPTRWPELQHASRHVQTLAWAPYSGFHVGAALLTDCGQIIAGCNVENSSFGLTICAERTAVCRAIASGYRQFSAICISLPGNPVPCGGCRQFLMEFNPQLAVLLDNTDQPIGTTPECVSLTTLLPRAFRFER